MTYKLSIKLKDIEKHTLGYETKSNIVL